MELFNVVTVEEAKKIISENFNYRVKSEIVNITECTGRILYRDVVSEINVPGFKRSTVDGYAVKAGGISGASESIPAFLDIKGEVLMGMLPEFNIDFPEECAYVPTGGMLPTGADSMVMIEYTEKLDKNTLLVNRPSAPGENIIEEDEDIRAGEVVIKAGTKLRPYEIGVLSSLGCEQVEVVRNIRVGIISTGDEIVGIDSKPGPGQIRDINTYLLYSLVKEEGGEPVIYGCAKDSYEALMDMVQMAYEECDMVLISGGSSVGKKDQTLKVLKTLIGSKILIHGIAIKPGKPTVLAKASEKAIFGLPGHPLACAVIFKSIVKGYMENITGHSEEEYPVSCIFPINYHKASGREEYLPVILEKGEKDIIAKPILAKSGIITAFSKSWGYVKIDRNLEGLREGERVMVYRF